MTGGAIVPKTSKSRRNLERPKFPGKAAKYPTMTLLSDAINRPKSLATGTWTKLLVSRHSTSTFPKHHAAYPCHLSLLSMSARMLGNQIAGFGSMSTVIFGIRYIMLFLSSSCIL